MMNLLINYGNTTIISHTENKDTPFKFEARPFNTSKSRCAIKPGNCNPYNTATIYELKELKRILSEDSISSTYTDCRVSTPPLPSRTGSGKSNLF
jgi:hypothetical protein